MCEGMLKLCKVRVLEAEPDKNGILSVRETAQNTDNSIREDTTPHPPQSPCPARLDVLETALGTFGRARGHWHSSLSVAFGAAVASMAMRIIAFPL